MKYSKEVRYLVQVLSTSDHITPLYWFSQGKLVSGDIRQNDEATPIELADHTIELLTWFTENFEELKELSLTIQNRGE